MSPAQSFSKHRYFFIFYFTCISSFSMWLFIQKPGFFIYDTFSLLSQLDQGRYSAWQSYIYSIYVELFFTQDPSLYSLGWFQVFLFSFIASGIWYWCFKKGCSIKWLSLMLILFILTPLNNAMAIFYNRDPLHAWLNIFLAFLVFLTLYYKKYNQIILIPIILLLTSLLVELRQDSVILFPTLLIIYWFQFGNKIKYLFFIALPLTLTFFIINILVPKSLRASNMPISYKMTSVLNPLGHIVKLGTMKSLTQEELEELESIVKIEDLIKHHTGFEIHVFHERLVNTKISPKKFNNLMKIYLKLCIENPTLFLKNRIHLFLVTIGLLPRGPTYITDSLNPSEMNAPSFMSSIATRFNIKKALLFPRFNNIQIQALNLSTREFYFLRLLFGSALFGILVLTGALLSFRKYPASASFSLIILTRILVVFFASPAAQFKYTYSLMLSFYFLVPLAYCEINAKRL